MAKKPVVPYSDTKGDKRAAEMRNKGIARIGDTPLSDAGVMRSFTSDPKSYAMGLEPKAFNTMAPGPRFAENLASSERNRKSDPANAQFDSMKLIRENRAKYAASLPGSKDSAATKNALAMAKARKMGGK